MNANEVPDLLGLDRLRREVEVARDALESLEARSPAAGLAAVRAGRPKRAVAMAAGVTRQSVDKWSGVWQRTPR